MLFSAASEFDLVSSSKPDLALLSSPDSVSRCENSFLLTAGKLSFAENDHIEIIPESAVCFETNGITLLYIFKECDIMNIEPKFRRADIIVLDGVSPETFPEIRTDYLILRKMGGYYSGTNEIIVLKDGEIDFFAYNGILKKGSFAR